MSDRRSWKTRNTSEISFIWCFQHMSTEFYNWEQNSSRNPIKNVAEFNYSILKSVLSKCARPEENNWNNFCDDWNHLLFVRDLYCCTSADNFKSNVVKNIAHILTKILISKQLALEFSNIGDLWQICWKQKKWPKKIIANNLCE